MMTGNFTCENRPTRVSTSKHECCSVPLAYTSGRLGFRCLL